MGATFGIVKTAIRWLSVGATVILLVGYFYDEQKSDGVVELLSPLSVTVTPEENAYFACLGQGAASGKDPHAAGLEIVQKIEEAVAADPKAAEQTRSELFGPPGLGINDHKGLMEKKCSIEDLLDLANEDKAAVESLLAANDDLLERYRRLLYYPHFQETLAFPYNAEFFPHLYDSNRLYLLDAFLLMKAGDGAGAVSLLEKDLSFWRMVLGEGRHIHGAMAAVSRINSTVGALAWAVDRGMVGPDDTAPLETVLSPLSPKELDMTEEIMRNHSSTLDYIARSLDKIRWYSPARIIVKPNATLNYYFTMAESDSPLFSLPTREYMELRDDVVEPSYFHGPLDVGNLWHSWFNFAGKGFADIGYMNMRAFADRVHTLDARLTLTRLQLSQARRGRGTDIAAALAAACPPSCNPFTGEPATWDAGEEAIFFMVPTLKEPKKVAVPLSRL